MSAAGRPLLDGEAWRRPLKTRRLRLEPLRAEDADDLHGVLDDPALHAFTGGAPLGREALRARCARLAEGRSADGHETWANWVVRRRRDGAALGYVQATIRGATAELAWVIGTRWQRRRYASEAAAAAAVRLRAIGVAELRVRVHPEHVASAGVARAAGLVPTGERDADGEVVWRGPAAAGR